MKILFVDIDTLRPDHMSCYGYNRKTTPNFDSIAQEGVRFTNYYCSDAPCLPSRAALVSGMFGIHNGAVGHGGTGGDKRYVGEKRGFKSVDDENNFNFIFRKAGMYTASISTFPERHSSWWFNSGYNETYNVGGNGGESGEEVLPVALDWIERNADRDNWFLHVHLWDPHTPYRAPTEFGEPFADVPLDNWITPEILEVHKKHVGPHGACEIGMYEDIENPKYPRHPGRIDDMQGLKRMFDGYDTGILYADYLVGQIFDLLKQKGIYDDTAIIITSDHGENMGEWGIYGEHATADHGTCNIPMIIKWPNCKMGHVDNDLHYNLDLVPTMAEMLKVNPYPRWDGQSYSKALKGELNTGRDYLVISQLAHVCQRSVRYQDWLYVRTYHGGWHLLDKEMLFNLKEDKFEQNNVAEKYPEICAICAQKMLAWTDEMMMNSESAIDPLWQVLAEGGPSHARGHRDSYVKRLRETGRSNGANKLEEIYPKKWK